MTIGNKGEDCLGKSWAENIKKGDERAFEKLFFEYFQDLTRYAIQITASQSQAKDIVQEVFYKLWKGRKQWQIRSSLKAYLYRAVHNEALNHIDRHSNRQETREQLAILKSKKANPESFNPSSKLVDNIWEIVSELPERRQSVFVLHRKHGLSYKEIAQVLNIRRKTVENHMGHALDDIRRKMDSDHL
ncbi:MAG: RNA polymerase sigma factor [Bacteroidota bacterium]